MLACQGPAESPVVLDATPIARPVQAPVQDSKASQAVAAPKSRRTDPDKVRPHSALQQPSA